MNQVIVIFIIKNFHLKNKRKIIEYNNKEFIYFFKKIEKII